MTNQLDQVQLLETKLADYYEHRHLTQAADGVFMATFREGFDIKSLLGTIERGEALDPSFFQATEGNFFDFIAPELKGVANRLIDLCPGGNGGMASVGRGEFAISFLSNYFAQPSKAGKGDLEIDGLFEEVKMNGGKINPSNDAGSLIKSRMNALAGELVKGDYFLPFTKKNAKQYAQQEIEKLNALYWQGVTGETNESLTDTELKALFVERSFQKAFGVSDSILVINTDGQFIRFTSTEQAVQYYSNKLETVSTELRANQNNPASIYLHV